MGPRTYLVGQILNALIRAYPNQFHEDGMTTAIDLAIALADETLTRMSQARPESPNPQ